ncbi:hypothetical protein [Streptomyces solincola]|uniref:hypothetical protein n=1 Tax=Streptomyces solincola TaxID=2100817 RepID=UPI002159399D|nr:hypothetical protein [Streptomyces solincola]
MGWTVLYIAFGVVALWLLGEVLLQYKARLRWRLLAFAGFLCVVLGVLLPSVLVIGAGAIAFAVGQTYVTLSFRRGFSTGWAVGGRPGASRRRRAGAAKEAGPTLEVSGLAAEPPAADPYAAGPSAEDPYGPGPAYPSPAASSHEPSPVETTAVYAPQPLPEDTGQYGVYGGGADAPRRPGAEPAYGGAFAGYDADPSGHGAYPGSAAEAGGHAYGDYGTSGEQPYAAYSDPYIGTSTAPSGPGYEGGYDGGYAPYGGPQPHAVPYDPYGTDTPPGGVWVPQQREGDQPPAYGYDPGQGQDPGQDHGPAHGGPQQPYRY